MQYFVHYLKERFLISSGVISGGGISAGEQLGEWVLLHFLSCCLRIRLTSLIASVSQGTVWLNTTGWLLNGACLSITLRVTLSY